MHPAVILIPAAGLILIPRLWAREMLDRHNRDDEGLPGTASELAREMLDLHQLEEVGVELTDGGDHYDPLTRTVRLARDKFDRKTLTAVTTAAHEVAHACQHASDYPAFRARERLARIARFTGLTGTLLLLAVPLTALITRSTLPTKIVGATSLTILGVGAAAQLSALPTELDASFNRALPMLRQRYLDPEQTGTAKKILVACSATYMASSLIGLIHLWPWLGSGWLWLLVADPPVKRTAAVRPEHPVSAGERRTTAVASRRPNLIRGGTFERVFRRAAKPLVRQWLKGTEGPANRSRKA